MMALASSGCVTFLALDPYLDKAVGQKRGAERYPTLTYERLVQDSEGSQSIEYSIDSLWRCRWIFEVEKATDIVKAWRYPDPDAKRYCSELPSSRP